MVEFAIVLIGKQKGDWDNKVSKLKAMAPMFTSAHSEKQSRCLASMGKIATTEDANNVSKTTIEREIPNTPLVVGRFAFLKELPRTTKIDFTAFAIFTISYSLFNIIYFVCSKQN